MKMIKPINEQRNDKIMQHKIAHDRKLHLNMMFHTYREKVEFKQQKHLTKYVKQDEN